MYGRRTPAALVYIHSLKVLAASIGFCPRESLLNSYIRNYPYMVKLLLFARTSTCTNDPHTSISHWNVVTHCPYTTNLLNCTKQLCPVHSGVGGNLWEKCIHDQIGRNIYIDGSFWWNNI